jgi:hypothetical protein
VIDMTICDCCGADIEDSFDRAHVMLPSDRLSDEELAELGSDRGVRIKPSRQLDVCRTCIAPLRAAADARRKTDN